MLCTVFLASTFLIILTETSGAVIKPGSTQADGEVASRKRLLSVVRRSPQLTPSHMWPLICAIVSSSVQMEDLKRLARVTMRQATAPISPLNAAVLTAELLKWASAHKDITIHLDLVNVLDAKSRLYMFYIRELYQLDDAISRRHNGRGGDVGGNDASTGRAIGDEGHGNLRMRRRTRGILAARDCAGQKEGAGATGGGIGGGLGSLKNRRTRDARSAHVHHRGPTISLSLDVPTRVYGILNDLARAAHSQRAQAASNAKIMARVGRKK